MFLRSASLVLVLATLAAQGNAQAPDAIQEKPRPSAKTQAIKGKPVTRGKFAAMLYEAFKTTLFQNDKSSEEAPFYDVLATDPDFKVISILRQHHILSGDAEGNFHAQNNPSRYEMAQTFDALITELKLANTQKLLDFTLDMPKDIPANVPACEAVERMIKLEVALPFGDSYFRGRRATTDAEIADGIARVQELVKASAQERAGEQKK